MKNNKSAETQKKLVLSSLLIAALAGPSLFQVSSKTVGSIEMAQTAATPASPAASASVANAPAAAGSAPTAAAPVSSAASANAARAAAPAAVQAPAQAAPAVPAAPVAAAPATSVAAAPATSVAAAPSAQQLADLAKQLADTRAELDARKKADEERAAKDKVDAEAKAETERLAKKARELEEERKKAELAKKKKEEEDCDKKEKAVDRMECRKEQKEERLTEAKDQLKLKFEESIATTLERCETSASRKENLDQEVLISSCMAGKMGSIIRKHSNMRIDGLRVQLEQQVVMEAFQENVGSVLNRLLYTDDDESELKAQGLLQSIMGAQIPTQFAGIKRRVMDDLRKAGDREKIEVLKEYQKMNSAEIKNNPELREQQRQVADAKKLEMMSQAGDYGAIVGNTLEQRGSMDTSALNYYRSNYFPNMAKILSAVSGYQAGALAAGDATTRTSRGAVEAGVARDSTNRGVVQTGNDKMRHSGTGVPWTERSTSTSNFNAGTESRNARSGSDARPGIRVGTAQ